MDIQPDFTADLSRDFRNAMRRLAATVTILTAKSETERHGMAATAVTSLTTEPPTLLACVNRSASIHNPIAKTGAFCVNLLACEHRDLVATFSGKEKGERRFDIGGWLVGERDVPYLEGAQANIFCKVVKMVVHRSHSIFIGEVESIRLAQNISPLIYQDGAYCRTITLEDQVAA